MSARQGKEAMHGEPRSDMILFGHMGGMDAADREPNAPAPAGKPPVGKDNAEIARKIIYTSRLEIVVEDIDTAQEQLEKATKEAQGYIAKWEVTGARGYPRSGTWTIRVPVPRFDAFRKALAEMGEVRGNSADSDDITDKFYDLQARLKTAQIEEESLRKMLQDYTSKNAKPAEVVPIRQELKAIRETIEVQQGQINRWDKETQLATVYLSLQDRKSYIPPSDPAFGTTLGRGFWNSVEALKDFGKGVVWLLVVTFPWLVVGAIVVIPVWLTWRRKTARAKA